MKIKSNPRPQLIYGFDAICFWDIEGGDLFQTILVTRGFKVLVKSEGHPWVRIYLYKDRTMCGEVGIYHPWCKEVVKIFGGMKPGGIYSKVLLNK